MIPIPVPLLQEMLGSQGAEDSGPRPRAEDLQPSSPKLAQRKANGFTSKSYTYLQKFKPTAPCLAGEKCSLITQQRRLLSGREAARARGGQRQNCPPVRDGDGGGLGDCSHTGHSLDMAR